MARMLGAPFKWDRDTRAHKRLEAQQLERELQREFAAFTDEATEWAEVALPAAAETWPAT